ncbi:signal recognition particle, SRP9/SRP14 subunit [Neocallimastix lanati (nom. inval.)]|uniref:Signal recognition particle 9 kDa protein n=1 Tax=Neocallimastix californiae TaxID=1754190 RepID=A0A1Y1Z4K4_9FUNG|nr:signal recognition particle, SRP9/SRP14 subunit [Neocallimastix sp. JGI-2020a]ORY05193.1 signal recognition particle, SRP9/SRP14 subunit [Neocallimastix californiae]|eukprot:ORY05193.1 signal recognition particle, SRP9/SRP14 subunit [Neocallimastix californiae]
MVYIDDWDTFKKAVEELYMESPLKTRYLIKYRNVDTKLVLKVTDGPTCIKYKTEYASDIKKLEKLNRSLLKKMLNTKKNLETKSSETAQQTNNITSPKISKKKKGKKGK